MTSVSRNLGLWLLLVIVSLVLWSVLSTQRARELEEVSYSDFVASVEQGKVDEVTIQGQGIRGQYRADEGGEPLHFKSYAPEDSDLVPLLRQHDVRIRARPSDDEPWYVIVLVQWAPMLLLLAVWVFFFRQMQIGGGKAMSFGKSRAKLLTENQHKVTFADVSGIERRAGRAEEIIAFLKDPKKLTRLGGHAARPCPDRHGWCDLWGNITCHYVKHSRRQPGLIPG